MCEKREKNKQKKKKQNSSSGEVSALTGDQTKGAIDTGIFTLTLPWGEQEPV